MSALQALRINPRAVRPGIFVEGTKEQPARPVGPTYSTRISGSCRKGNVMANTYSQIYIQIVFAVEGRQNVIDPKHNDELQKYITGIVAAQRQKLIAINNMPDHAHILIGQRPDSMLSDLVGDIKSGSTNFINRNGWVKGRFNWQEGFGAFSYSRSQL